MTAPSPELRDTLSWLEGTLLCAIRTWVACCKRGAPVHDHIEPIFASLRSIEAARYLDGLMCALNEGCTRMIDVQCLCNPALTPDETILLDCFAMAQDGADGDATTLLQAFVVPAKASAAAGNALGVVQLLNDAGHILTRDLPAFEPGPGNRDPFFIPSRSTQRN